MANKIVVGLCYGDEGKGATVNHLAGYNDLVIRYNGGHQAGHTAVDSDSGHRHVFASFGSGTLNGAETFVSKYCTFDPLSYATEREALIKAGYNPVLYLDPMAMITTPYDVMHNRIKERSDMHGSVGVGFGSTVERNQNSPYKLFAVDLNNKYALKHKLDAIRQDYYCKDDGSDVNLDFLYAIDNVLKHIQVFPFSTLHYKYENLIFEGAQGTMLDMDHGYFPHVTRSNTSCKNAIEMHQQYYLDVPDMYYVMRAYATRHGNGPLPLEDASLTFEDKTNVHNKYQGTMRFGYHSSFDLKHALRINYNYSGSKHFKLVITCMDQSNGYILMDKKEFTISEFCAFMGITRDMILISNSPDHTLFPASSLAEIK